MPEIPGSSILTQYPKKILVSENPLMRDDQISIQAAFGVLTQPGFRMSSHTTGLSNDIGILTGINV